MPVIRIDRWDDARLADYRGVSDGELLRRRSRFVGEGRLVVARLIESGHRVESILVNDASFRSLESMLPRLPEDVPVYVCDTGEFSAITGFNLHRGCLALAERPAVPPLAEVLSTGDRLLVLEGISDADNVGTAFRNAAAFGARVLLNDSCCDPLYRKAIRTSMGSVLRTPYARVVNWPADLSAVKQAGFTLAALTPRADALDLQAWAKIGTRRKIALLVGSEGPGLTAAAQGMADVCLRIPIGPEVDSLNLGTAAGIALYCLASYQPRTTNHQPT